MRDRADMERGKDGQKDGQWIKERLICLCYEVVAPYVVSSRTGAVLFSLASLFGVRWAAWNFTLGWWCQ